MFTKLLEKLKRPGLLGLIGMRVEKRCREDLLSYFGNMGRRIAGMQLEQLADPASFVHDAHLVPLARHAVEMKLNNTLRIFTPLLKGILEVNIQDAVTASSKIHHLAEADAPEDLPNYIPGMTAEEAALYASVRAGELVSGINATTQKIIADVIEEGITQQLGVDGTKRLLQASLKDMAANRARMIASTEMNDAFSEATMRKLERMQVEYKQWITSADACDEICVPNEEQGPIPIDDLFQSGDARPPAHPNCRCAVSGARAPATLESLRQLRERSRVSKDFSFRECLQLAEYSDDEPRDEIGRWTSGGGGAAGKSSEKPAKTGSRSFTLENGRTIQVSYKPEEQKAQLEKIREEEFQKLPENVQDGLNQNQQTSAIHQVDGKYTDERTAMHDQVVDGYLAGHETQANPQIAFIGGGPASGKTTASNEAKAAFGDSVYVNVDDIRARLPEYGALVGDGRVGLGNEESGYLRDLIVQGAGERGYNIVLDGVGSSSAAAMLNSMERSGYKVSYSFVYKPLAEAQIAAAGRPLSTSNLSDLREMPSDVVAKFHDKARSSFPEIATSGREVKIYNKTGGTSGSQAGKVVFWKTADGTVKVDDSEGLKQVLNGGSISIAAPAKN